MTFKQLIQNRGDRFKRRFTSWDVRKNEKKGDRNNTLSNTSRRAGCHRRRVYKRPTNPKRSLPSQYAIHAVAYPLVAISQPHIYQVSAAVIDSARRFIHGLFHRTHHTWTWGEFQMIPPGGSQDTSELWTKILDKTQTISMLLQTKGGHQKQWESRSKHPSPEKHRSFHQTFRVLHQIYAELFVVARYPTPSAIQGFWEVCQSVLGTVSQNEDHNRN